MASTVRLTPVSLNTISSADLACLASISFLVIICTCCELYLASSCARFAVTNTDPSACATVGTRKLAPPIHVAMAQESIRYFFVDSPFLVIGNLLLNSKIYIFLRNKFKLLLLYLLLIIFFYSKKYANAPLRHFKNNF